MKLKKIELGDKEVWPFTIPSGIIMTEPRCAAKLLNEIPWLGIWTTKSYTREPRKGNRESILTQYEPGSFGNAVGLANPGAEQGREQIKQADIPDDRFVLGSSAGSCEKEFVFIIETLDDVVDGHELNFSCPHAEGHGSAIGTDPNLVYDITRAVCQKTKKPVFAKLTPNTSNLEEIARASVRAGARGIVAINTVGPGYYSHHGHAILTNKVGGMSGRAIMPIGLKCVREIMQAVGKEIPIIGMGGIRTARDIEEYSEAGADVFGIGSALAGMADRDILIYLNNLVIDLGNRTNYAGQLLKKVDMAYKGVRIQKVGSYGDFKVFKTDTSINAKPGQFVFAAIPAGGSLQEKPFSVMDDDPFTLGVLSRGEFTRAFNQLQEGDEFYFRGPYGREVYMGAEENKVLVAGGCGIAGINLIAKRASALRHSAKVLLGFKTSSEIPDLTQLQKWAEGEVYVATEDGSYTGKNSVRGRVTNLFSIANLNPNSQFFNCGPREMVDAVERIELENGDKRRIYSSLDYITSCGVGLCGKCADEKGRRTCVEGPFMRAD
ncbi:MAG: tRNA-dihydrouridine synthase [Nanoarchaeota archaeon]|nr:tRNA-dihydrouridine synthase [Nanoarchaeota archaeon]